MSDEGTTSGTVADTGQTTAAATTSATSEPWYKDWVQSDGTLNNTALDRLPDHLKPLKDSWGRAKTIDDLGTSAINAQVLIGKKALAPLPPGSPPEAIAARKQLLDTINGVPSDPKSYGIARPQDIPEGNWDQKLADSFSAWAHKYSVPPAAAKELLAMQAGSVKSSLQSQQQYEAQFWGEQQKRFESSLRAENVPLDRANALVEKGAVAAGLDLNAESTKIFLKGSDARLLAMRHAMAIGEDNASVPGATSGDTGGNLDDRIAEARGHPAFWNKENRYSRTEHDAAVNRVNELLRLKSEQELRQNQGQRVIRR